MNVASSPSPAGQLVYTTPTTRASLSRQAKAGRITPVGKGIYLSGATIPLEDAVRKHRFELVSRFWPGAVVCDRSALAGGEVVDGWLFICHPDPPRGDLQLPGLTISVRVGPGPLPGDLPWLDGLHLSGTVRGLVENIPSVGRPPVGRPARAAGRLAVESVIDTEVRGGGDGRVAVLLAQLDQLRPFLPSTQVEVVRETLAHLLGTYAKSGPVSEQLRSRLSGNPFDQRRVELFETFRDYLLDTAPSPKNADGSRWEWLPFFESYFSNFIEGTKFEVDEARSIAIDGKIPAERPTDAHDVQATYRVAVDPVLSRLVAKSGAEFVEQLREVNRIIMAARPEKKPGMLKDQDNFFGNFKFVEHELVEGTLTRAFDCFAPVTDPFQRAAALMLVATECHPFYDGNGRTARLVANATLSAAGQVRVVIPSIYRNDYLRGLRGVSNGNGRGETLLAVLGFAQRWTAMVDWSTFDLADGTMRKTNAYEDPSAVGEDVKLVMPPRE